MPRKYTRHAPPVDGMAPALPNITQMDAPAGSAPTGFYPQLSALEQYGLWLKQNQHITNALPPEPPKPRKVTK